MRLFPALLTATALMLPGFVQAEGRSIIVLDASGSMWGQIEGRAKLEIAREALGSVLSGMDPTTEIGLMAYGHREKGSCTDIELVVPPAAGTGQAIIDAANAMKFLGKTPLSDAVKLAAEDLKYTEDAATVILITDGIETCEADPCALGAALESAGVNFTAHVVGFGLTEEEGRAVACLAENTGGKYIQASDSGALIEALKTTVVVAEPEPAPEPAALADNVDPVVLLVAGGAEPGDPFIQDVVFSFTPLGADGQDAGDQVTIYGRQLGALPAGAYRMETTLHSVTVTQTVEIGPETALSQPTAVLDAGIMDLKLVTEAGGAPAAEAQWELRGADDLYDTGYAQALRVIPSGEHALSARLGSVEASDSLVITAGEVTEKTIILAAAVPVFTAFYAPGVPVEDETTFEVFDPSPALDGSRTRIDVVYRAGNGPELPPGDYVVVATAGRASAELPFTLKAGERVAVDVVLNAGIGAFTAPNANSIEIFAAKQALDGSRTRVEVFYGPEGTVILPAGDYVALATAGEASAETAFSIKPAERSTVTIEASVGAVAISAPGAGAIDILPAATALDGSRERITYFYNETAEALLPPGDYIAVASRDDVSAETPFTITADQRTEVVVTLVMGLAAVSAEGADAIDILPATAGLDGDRPRLFYAYSGAAEVMLAPGSYVAVAKYADGSEIEQAFTITDGARADVVVTRP
ncbi:MAG: VWA domain-containing protein [Rhodobacteraceae bacterium]|nr:VWA domain-containing protein [Paracoccaceae bacterium]